MDVWLILGVNVLVSGGAAFFGAYLRRKGENLATKQDVAEITAAVERVKAEFERERIVLQQDHDLRVRQQDWEHQLRLAALDRRLQAHQDAFHFWWRLSGILHGEPVDPDALMGCASEFSDWWSKNCLYLSPKVREVCREMVGRVKVLSFIVELPSNPEQAVGEREAGIRIRATPEAARRTRDEERARFTEIGKIIVEASALPSLGDEQPIPVPASPPGFPIPVTSERLSVRRTPDPIAGASLTSC